MTLTAQQTCLVIEPTDGDGYPNAPEVSVWIDYVQSVDCSYGEDADGRQGVARVEYEILDAFIGPEDLKRLTSQQAEAVLQEARYIFTTNKKHF